MDTFVDVVFDLPVRQSFLYRVPPFLAPMAEVGRRVMAPFGRRRLVGYILDTKDSSDIKELKTVPQNVKDVIDIIDDEPLFDEKRLAIYRWISTHYLAPLGEVIGTAHSLEVGPREERVFYLTPDGMAAEDKDDLPGQILALIKRKGKVSIRAIRRSFRGRAIYAALSSLKKKGLIQERSYIRRREGKGERVVSYTGKAIKGLERAPKQMAILKRVAACGEVLLEDLRSEFPGLYKPLRTLKKKGFVEISSREVVRTWQDEPLPTHNGTLMPEQESVLERVKKGLGRDGVFLLHGVTGSGKTAIYLRLMEEVISRKKRVIFLAPEIALASRLSRYILARFRRVALIHSGLSQGERIEQLNAIKRGEVDVVAGPRSAIFMPLKDVGLIIVDEEHEPSYKQEEGVRYNARDVAILLGRFYSCPVLLGSATPAVESFHSAMEGRFHYLELPRRVEGRPMPEVRIVDMRGEKKDLSGVLLAAIGDRLKRGQQVILFINKKGYCPAIICRDCGYVYKCPHCLIALTFYKRRHHLRCHYCGFIVDAPSLCASCGGYSLRPLGIGIEKVAEEVEKAFPDARVGRIYREVVRKGEGVWEAFDRGELDILVGTQVLAKGYHFPRVTLVGVVAGDQALNLPDFRATERTFQVLTQVAGRAGRGEEPGEVIIQTYNPDEPCFRSVTEHDYRAFYDREVAIREEVGYPPFSRLINLIFEGRDMESVILEARRLKEELKVFEGKDLEILGPGPAFYQRLRGRWRWQMVLKGRGGFEPPLKEAICDYRPSKGVKISIDVDPIHLL